MAATATEDSDPILEPIHPPIAAPIAVIGVKRIAERALPFSSLSLQKNALTPNPTAVPTPAPTAAPIALELLEFLFCGRRGNSSVDCNIEDNLYCKQLS